MGLKVDVDEVRAAGSTIAQSVSKPGALSQAAVSAAAGDQVSTGVAAALTSRFHVLATHSAMGTQAATAAAALLHSNASTYQSQEDANTAYLGANGSSQHASAPSAGLNPLSNGPVLTVPPPSVPSGVMATDSKQIAALIHSGPGSQSLLDAAARARAHADELRAISTELRGASDRLSRGWQSPAADAATAKIVSLSSWYDQQAGHAEAAARVAENQAEVFNRTRSQIPKPEVFDDLQRRLEAANRANVAARGAYTPVITQLQTELQQVHSQTNAAYAGYQTRAADLGAGGSAPPPMTVQAVDFKQEFGDRDPRLPKAAVDPKNPYIGDERYGHWENVVPPPYVGKTPPPPATGHRDLSGFPGKGPAGPTGFYVPGGQTWIDDNAPPAATFQEQYRIRISGEDLTSYTRMVGGQQQQWVQYTYESQRWTKVEINELSGINPPPVMGDWNPITPQQISALSANNPSVTYYIPNGCGGQFTVSGGVPTSGFTPPIVPSMTAGR